MIAISLFVVHAVLASAPAPAIPFTKIVLKNGLEVIIHEDHRVPLVAVDMWIHVGSGDEVPGKTGFAHLFEHKMFQGSKNVPEDKHFDILREAGGSGINGTTNSDRTNYFEVVPTNQIETALWLESDRLGFLLDHVSEASMKNQIEVVRNERRQRYDNVPYGAARFAVYEAMFPEGHPYRYLTIGKHEDIENAKLDDVKAFFKKWYAPVNATVAITGDVDVKRASELAEKWFGGLATPDKPPRVIPPTPTLAANVRQEIHDPFAKLVRVQYAWHGPKRYAADDVDLDTAADVLGHDGWGRLQKILVVDKQLCASVAAYQEDQGFSGLFNISATLKPGVQVKDVESIIRAELLKLLDQGPTAAELHRSVVETDTAVIFSLDEIMSRTEQLQSYNHYTGDPGYLTKYLEEVRSRTPESVRMAARRWLAKPRVEIVTLPAVQNDGGGQ